MKINKKYIISPNASVRDAISTIEKSGVQIALAVRSGKLIGTVTDGDIRRAFLNKGIKLDDPISEIINKKFTFINEKNNKKKDVILKMKQEDLRHIPVIDNKGYLKDLFFINDLLNFGEASNEIVIMAGGKGLRLGKLTKNCPKPMLKINNKPILEIILEQCANQGFKKFHISVNYLKEQIKKYFKNGSNFNVKINYLEEKSFLGTAGSLNMFKKKPTEPFLVINGDVLSKINLKNLIDFHNDHSSDITICVKEYINKIPYGIIDINGCEVNSLKEKPTITNHINAGIYLINPDILKLLPKNKYFEMTDLINLAKEKKYKINAFPIYEYWQDLGYPENLIQTENQW
jgi:dTDP-glucose pyrophosphorylase